MAEVTYESKITSSPTDSATIFSALSDLGNLERVRDLIPQERVRDIEFDRDHARFKVDGLGQKITIRVVDREPNKTIKFATENSPMAVTFWIQLKEIAPADTRLKLTLRADLPMMLKMMLDKKLQEGLNQAADMLAQMPYKQWTSV